MLEHQIKMGRDALFDLLSIHGLLVKRRKRRIQTTHSFHWLRKHPNLIKNWVPDKVNSLWVSDITYWKIQDNHVYLSLVTDAYSHKIVGYELAETLEAQGPIKSLKMALSGLNNWPEHHSQLIHHSDRGIQYCSKEYVKLLQDNQILISMTENGDPLENAIAERVNGILKDEYLLNFKPSNIGHAKEILQQSVTKYNEERPHMSINNLTPHYVHQLSLIHI